MLEFPKDCEVVCSKLLANIEVGLHSLVVILFESRDDLEEMVGILIEKRSPRDITLLAGEQIMENGFVGHDVRFGSEIEEHWMPLNDREMRLVWQGDVATTEAVASDNHAIGNKKGTTVVPRSL